jgi:CRP-like cAMP-binding protein
MFDIEHRLLQSRWSTITRSYKSTSGTDDHLSKFKNTLLQHLDEDIIDRLSLTPMNFETRHEIEYPGRPIEHLYFVEEGMASMTTTFKDGSQVEVGMFGYASVIGVPALMGTKLSLYRVYTQIEGRGFSCSIEAARAEFGRGDLFQALMLRYAQAQLVQAAQSAACNAKHNMEQRLARWLLLCSDRANTETFKISQEFLSDMLGSTRPTVSIAAGTLKEEGLIEYNRGVIRIIDPGRLEQRACECYDMTKKYLDNYADVDATFTS